jgi:hypothetical protein
MRVLAAVYSALLIVAACATGITSNAPMMNDVLRLKLLLIRALSVVKVRLAGQRVCSLMQPKKKRTTEFAVMRLYPNAATGSNLAVD